MADIVVEEDHIKTVEEEMHEEREQLKSERAYFQERQTKLAEQQVRGEGGVPHYTYAHTCVCACVYVYRPLWRASSKLSERWRINRRKKQLYWSI
jgi:hypothetical protein